MAFIFGWLVLCCVCFFFLFCNGADLRFRMSAGNIDDGFWKFHRDYFAEGFRLLRSDHFGLHCPWNWETAKHHRLAHMREYLGENGRTHEVLGHITCADCDDPAKQEAIARHSFISRTAYWMNSVLGFILSPLQLIVLVVLAFVLGVVMMIMAAWDKVFG